MIKNNLALKLKDPESFFIPCVIGNTIRDIALCDLGASISLMPLSIRKRLHLCEIKA